MGIFFALGKHLYPHKPEFEGYKLPASLPISKIYRILPSNYMPIIKSAIKKMHQDRARTQNNEKTRAAYKKAVKTMRSKPGLETLKAAFSAIDTAAKKHVIHKNKAARLKSHLSRLTIKTTAPKTAAA